MIINFYNIGSRVFHLLVSVFGFFLIVSIVFMFLHGCSVSKLTPIKTPEIKFNPTQNYDVKSLLSNIKKPEKMKVVFVNNNFREVDPEAATGVLILPKEYAKVAALLKICNTYKEVILEQENLVNIHIDTINSLKEFIKLEQSKSDTYKELWVNSENAYRQEKHDHKVDNIINKATTISIGAIMAILLII